MRAHALLIATALLGGCAAQSGRAAPIDFREGEANAAASSPSAQPLLSRPASKEPDWADGPGVPLSAFALRPEEAQPFDPAAPPAAYAVQPGDTLYRVASMFQAPLRTLIDLNRLSPPFTLSPGQVLSLPKPNFHTVDKGETLIAIAGRFNVDARSLALLNRMAPPYTLRAGDRLVLPALARASVAPSAAPPSRTPPRATPKPGPGAEPPPKPTIKFAWPLRGQILARFGPQDGGRRSDGVEIAGSEGAKVAAAAAGKVIYAGDDLPGYGNLVLVQHPGGWVTAYAHARTLLAKEGQQVAQGQPIAELGARAGGSPRLLFQIRQGAAPADPLPLLPPT